MNSRTAAMIANSDKLTHFRTGIKRTLTDSIQSSGMDRGSLAERLEKMSATPVTKNMLDRYCSPSADNRLPADMLPALTHSCGPEVLAEIARLSGFFLVDANGMKLIEIGQKFLAVQQSQSSLSSALEGSIYDA